MLNRLFYWPTWPRLFNDPWDQPVVFPQGSSTFKYGEDGDVITYELSVPDTVDESEIDASLKDGILTVKLPKFKPVEVKTDGSKKVKVK